MNISDSERISGAMKRSGLKPAKSLEESDLAVINMCSVRRSASDRILGSLPKFKGKTTVLTGCILPKERRRFSKFFDYVLDIKELGEWPFSSFKEKDYFRIEPEYSSKFSACIPIMTGCNNFCSYCAVPYTRGREISRPKKEIIKEAKTLVEKGFKEIWLLGQNVNSYKYEFSDLLRKINTIPGKFWIRFTSSHPKDFSEDLIKTMKECSKITPYLNLPVQSGDSNVLKRMNRPYTIKKYKEIVKKIRKEIPEISISTDVIVGFCGETKKEFENTKKLFKEIKYDMAYINKYSERPGTESAEKMKDDISKKEKSRREKELNEILKETALKNNKKYEGKTIEVLISEFRKGFLYGKSKNYKTVRIEGSEEMVGSFRQVKIKRALSWGLEGILK